MKKTASILALTAGIAFNTAAPAAGFNERDVDFIASVQPGSGASASRVNVIPQGFNERGVNFIAEVPAGSNMPGGKVYITGTGFNDRGFDSIN